MLTELLILPFLSANVWLASGHSLCFDSLHSQVYVVNYISLPNWEGDMVRLVCRYLPKTNIGSCTTSPHWPGTCNNKVEDITYAHARVQHAWKLLCLRIVNTACTNWLLYVPLLMFTTDSQGLILKMNPCKRSVKPSHFPGLPPSHNFSSTQILVTME